MDNNNDTLIATTTTISNPKSVCNRSIFKKQVPLDQLYTLIHSICPCPSIKLLRSDNVDESAMITFVECTYYTLDISAFKRGIFLGIVEPFMQMLATDYYNKRCAFYAERSMKTPAAFAHFVQVIKHVCKYNNILITSALKYEQSQSNKVYYIHFKTDSN
jgi:hypothetical protein